MVFLGIEDDDDDVDDDEGEKSRNEGYKNENQIHGTDFFFGILFFYINRLT